MYTYIYIYIYVLFVFALQWLFLIRNIVTVQMLLRLACYIKIWIPKKNVHELFVRERRRFVCQVKFCTLLTNLSIETCVPSQPWCPPESRESQFVPKGLIYFWNQHCHIYIYIFTYMCMYAAQFFFHKCTYIYIYTHLYKQTSINVCIHSWTIYIYIYVYMNIYIYTINIYTHMCSCYDIYIYTYIHSLNPHVCTYMSI